MQPCSVISNSQVPATGLWEVSLADRILSFSELDPSMTPSKLQESNAYKKDILSVREVKLTKKCGDVDGY